ncbi:MAG TPA: hypothetical protein VF748_14845 [Candidatus Acidoferrum sp.]
MSNIPWAQIGSLIRSLTPFIGGLLVMRGVMNQTQFDSLANQIGTVVTDMTVLGGMLAPVATAVWGMATHTNAAVVKAAGQVPGATVLVKPEVAEPAVVAAAKDASVPGVELDPKTQPPKAS